MEIDEEGYGAYHTLGGRRVMRVNFTAHTVDDMERERFERDEKETRRIREERGLNVGLVGRYPNEAYRRDVRVPRLSERIYRENRHTFEPPARSQIAYRDIPYEIRDDITRMLNVRDLAKVSHLLYEWNTRGEEELMQTLGEVVIKTMKEDDSHRPYLVGQIVNPTMMRIERMMQAMVRKLEIKNLYIERKLSSIVARKIRTREHCIIMVCSQHNNELQSRGGTIELSYLKVTSVDPSQVAPNFMGVYSLMESLMKVIIELTDLKVMFVDRHGKVMQRF